MAGLQYSTLRKYDVLVAGELNVDLIFSGLTDFPSLEKEVIATHHACVLGSSSAIFAHNIAALGARVAFVGAVGQDYFGSFILEHLQSKNIDTQYINYVAGVATGLTIVMEQAGQKANVTFPGAMQCFQESMLPDSLLAQARHLHISSVFLQPSLRACLTSLLKRAKQRGLSTSVDPQWDIHQRWDFPADAYAYIDYFMPNTAEFCNLSHTPNLEEALKNWQQQQTGVAIVKDGESGAYWADTHMIQKVSTLPNPKVVDTIGAGDSFNAGFILKMLEGGLPMACMEFGNTCGTRSTTARGGTGAFEKMPAEESL